MTLLFYITNFLFAYLGFLCYNTAYQKKCESGNYISQSTALFLLWLLIPGVLIIAYFLFDNLFLRPVELITSLFIFCITVHCLKLAKEKRLRERYIESLQIAKDGAEIEALKLQLHPHFLFNSLNTLHHLINPENEDAKKYVQLLADTYRYTLKNKSNELVLLTEELSFCQQYFELLTIRYGKAIHLNIQADAVKIDDYLVIPVSIQLLIENAVKHNRFTIEEPLQLLLNVRDESVSVKNMVRGISTNDSFKIGLKNLSERSLIITNKPIIINSSDAEFAVSLPLIKYR